MCSKWTCRPTRPLENVGRAPGTSVSDAAGRGETGRVPRTAAGEEYSKVNNWDRDDYIDGPDGATALECGELARELVRRIVADPDDESA